MITASQFWFSRVPVSGSLVHMGGAEQFFFAERRALELQADGKAGFGKSARESDATQAGEVQADGV
jgi:hypothetical protein